MVDGKPKYKPILLHRFIMNAKKNESVDHEKNKSLDNRKSKLRISTQKQNSCNRRGKNSNNTSGHRNISLNKRTNEWMVQLQDHGKNRRWNFPFDKLEEAVKFAEEKRKELYGEFAGRDDR